MIMRHILATLTAISLLLVSCSRDGKIEYRLDKQNIIHCPIGKVSFSEDKLNENFDALMEAINLSIFRNRADKNHFLL